MILQSKSGMNEHLIQPFELRISVFFFAPHPNLSSNHATLGFKWKLKNKSGMNDRLIQPFELRICQMCCLFFHGGFEFELKSCYYWAQMKKITKKPKKRRATKKSPPPPKCCGHRKIVKPESSPYGCLAC